jgi:hypothetical protein
VILDKTNNFLAVLEAADPAADKNSRESRAIAFKDIIINPPF